MEIPFLSGSGAFKNFWQDEFFAQCTMFYYLKIKNKLYEILITSSLRAFFAYLIF